MLYLYFKKNSIIQNHIKNINEEQQNEYYQNPNTHKKSTNYEARLKSKRANYLSDLQKKEHITQTQEQQKQENQNSHDNHYSSVGSEEDTYIYNLQDVNLNKDDRILIVSKDDILFSGVIFNNMIEAESILHQVSIMYDNAYRSHEMVKNELEKPIKSLQLQIKKLIDTFDKKNKKLHVTELTIPNLNDMKEFKMDYTPWLTQTLNTLNDVNQTHINSSFWDNIVSSFSTFIQKIKEKKKEEELKKKERIQREMNTNSIETFWSGVIDEESSSLQQTKSANDINDLKKEIQDTLRSNKKFMNPLDSFFLTWETFLKKVEFIKKGLIQMDTTFNTIEKRFESIYNAFIDFIPVIERYFYTNINDIINDFNQHYPHLDKIKSLNIPMTNFDYVKYLPKDKTLSVDPKQMENVKTYVHRAIRNIMELINKNTTAVKKKIAFVKTAFVDGIDASSFYSTVNYTNGYLLFQKSYYNEVMDVQKIMDTISKTTVKYETDLTKMLKMIEQEEPQLVGFQDDIHNMLKNIQYISANMKNSSSSSNHSSQEAQDSQEIESIKTQVSQLLTKQKKILELKSKLSDILNQLYIDVDIDKHLKKIENTYGSIDQIYLELPNEFKDFESNVDIYETNALKMYDSSAFIYMSIESQIYSLLEDILHLKKLQGNKLFQDFFFQSKSYFE